MITGLIGKKVGMTQVIQADGTVGCQRLFHTVYQRQVVAI